MRLFWAVTAAAAAAVTEDQERDEKKKNKQGKLLLTPLNLSPRASRKEEPHISQLVGKHSSTREKESKLCST